MGSQCHITKTIQDTLNPKWNSNCQFFIKDLEQEVLCITVFERDQFSPDGESSGPPGGALPSSLSPGSLRYTFSTWKLGARIAWASLQGNEVGLRQDSASSKRKPSPMLRALQGTWTKHA